MNWLDEINNREPFWITKIWKEDGGYIWQVSGSSTNYINLYNNFLNKISLKDEYTNFPRHVFNFVRAEDEEYLIQNYSKYISEDRNDLKE